MARGEVKLPWEQKVEVWDRRAKRESIKTVASKLGLSEHQVKRADKEIKTLPDAMLEQIEEDKRHILLHYRRDYVEREATQRAAQGNRILEYQAQQRHTDELLHIAELWLPRLRFPTATRIPFTKQILYQSDVETITGIPSACYPDINGDDPEWRTKERRFVYLREHLEAAGILEDYEEWEQIEDRLESECLELSGQIREEAEKELAASILKDKPVGTDTSLEIQDIRQRWDTFLERLKGKGDSGHLDAFLRQACQPVALNGDRVLLGFYYEFHRSRVEEPRNRIIIERELRNTFSNIDGFDSILTPRPNGLISVNRIPFEYYEYVYCSVMGKTPTYFYTSGLPAPIRANLKQYLKEGTTSLPELGEQDFERLLSTHDLLVAKYSNSAKVKELVALAESYAKVLANLKSTLELLVDRRELPGTCKACPSVH